jgi:hypothetical protein
MKTAGPASRLRLRLSGSRAAPMTFRYFFPDGGVLL